MSCGSNAGMETTAPVVNAIVNNAPFHSNYTHQSDAVSNHSQPALLSDKLVAPDFVINCVEIRTVQCPEIQKFIWVSYIIALSDLRQRMMHRMLTTSKIHQK